MQSIPPDDRGCLTVCVSDDGEGDTVALVFGEGVYHVGVHKSSYSINCTLLMKRFGIQHRQKFDVRVETVRGRTALVFDVTKPVPPVRPPSELRSRMATLAYGGTGTEDNDD